MLSTNRYRVLMGLFALSGAAGLVDQVCFAKYLSYVVGSTAYAVSAVLAAFMTGLAAGAALGGRFSHRVRRHLVAYGGAEVVAGLAVAFAPLAFTLLTPAYAEVAQRFEGSIAALSVLRWVVALSVVFVPTLAMGFTLPVVTPLLAAEASGTRLSRLYAANTFGGATGALLGAYFILPALGLSGTLYASAALSAAVGLAAVRLGGELEVAPSEVASASTAGSARPTAGEGVLSFASGFLVFTAEVVATHLLAVIVGNSAYAFGLILAVFLVCLFAGAAVAPLAARRLGAAALPASLCATAVCLIATIPAWDKLPLAFHDLGETIVTFEGREAMRALIAFAVLAIPVTFMGLTFPLLLQQAALRPHAGALVGRLTAVNTLGAVTGALFTGYVLLPVAGSQGTLIATALAFAALAPIAFGGVARAGRVVMGAAAGVVALAAVACPGWDTLRLTTGTNVYFDEGMAGGEVVFMKEDVHGGITTVTSNQGVFTLYTNGKFQGNTGWEMQAQRYFAHYPCLFVDTFDRALVIGLGTGTTLGTLAAYPFSRLDVVEISPSIVEAARTYFTMPNRGVLENDARVHLSLDDARNWLLVNDDRFDLVSMELSSVWFAGAASLYSREFYALMSRHLTERGIFQQWVQLHHIERDTFAVILRTLRAEFPHVALFVGGGQGILVASQKPLTWDKARARRFSADPALATTLPGGRRLDTLTRDIVLAGDGLDAFLEEVADEASDPLVSTDDNLHIEYETPRGNVLPWSAREDLIREMLRYRNERAIAALSR